MRWARTLCRRAAVQFYGAHLGAWPRCWQTGRKVSAARATVVSSTPWKAVPDLEMHERGVLRLDVHKAARELPFVPRLSTDQALSATVDWYKTWIARGDMRIFTLLQIESLGALDA